ncbi:hypothetical protein KAW18_16175 [candidate division WOR-3 bacterium]|nr:hypothetical protein [candidate division WOR-3 bacterium]
MMDGFEVNGISLYLTHIPNRKGLVFCFMEGGSLYPVAYVSAKLEERAINEWKKMLGEKESEKGRGGEKKQ